MLHKTSSDYLTELFVQFKENWPRTNPSCTNPPCTNSQFLKNYEAVHHLPEFQQALSKFKLIINSRYYRGPHYDERYDGMDILGCRYVYARAEFKLLNQEIDRMLPSFKDAVIDCLYHAAKFASENAVPIILLTAASCIAAATAAQLNPDHVCMQNRHDVLLNNTDMFSVNDSLVCGNQDEVRNLVSNKMYVDLNDQANNHCPQIQEKIFKVATQKNFNKEHILFALKQKDFSIRCSNNKNQERDEAYFDTKTSSINFYSLKELRSDTVIHEFYHASNFLLHKNGPCQGTNDEKPAIVYPYSDVELKKYHEALALGDKQLEYFFELLEKVNAKVPLTQDEEALYDDYSDAIKDCLPVRLNRVCSEDEYNDINQKLINDIPVLLPNEKGKIVDAFKMGSHFVKVVESINVKSLVRFLIILKNDLLESEVYRSFSPFRKIAEREAYTFQSLTKIAQEKIYKEAYLMRQHYIEICTDVNAASPLEKR